MNQPRESRQVRFPWSAASAALVAVWTIGQILRDRFWVSGLMFYLPAPVLSAWLVLAAWKSRGGASAGTRRLFFPVLLAGPLCFVLVIENHWQIRSPSAPVSDGSLRLVHWNICRPVLSWQRQRDFLLRLDSDVIVLSEVTASVRHVDFPGYTVIRLGELLVAARGPLQASGSLVRGGAMQAHEVRCTLESGLLRIIVGDMTSKLMLHRDPWLQPLIDVAREREAHIVVGDMNAPRRSRAFARLPDGFRHAYDEAGHGWSYTWPVPIPVLAIDQCICGPGIRPLKYELQSTLLSDHRIQILDFTFTR